MSAFSEKCKELLEENGYTVYYLSIITDLDRTTLQRMVTGKRLPNPDFVLKFMNSLSINENEKELLLTLYDIERYGKEHILQRQLICSIIEEVHLEISPQSYEDNLLYPAGKCSEFHKNIQHMSSPVNVKNLILETLYYEILNNEVPVLYSNLPSDYNAFFTAILYLNSISKKTITIYHNLMLLRNRKDTLTALYNLSVFKAILQCTLNSRLRYLAYYRYINTLTENDASQPFYYYVLTSKSIIWISAKFDLAYRIENTDHAAFMATSIVNMLSQNTIFIQQFFTKEAAMESYKEIMLTSGQPSYVLQACPPLCLMQPTSPQTCINTHYYYTQTGIQYFEETGYLTELQTLLHEPLPKGRRKEMINYFLSHYKSDLTDCFLINNKLKFPLNLHIEIFSDKAMILYTFKEHTLLSYIYIREASICRAFYNFCQHLKSP